MPSSFFPNQTREEGRPRVVVRIGGRVEGRGGYFYLSDVGLFAGTAARNLAAKCVGNTYALTAVIQNIGTAIGPIDS